MIVVNSSTRQFNIPGADMTFGVEADNGSERKVFQCPRYVGNGLDVAGSFVRINYRNANGDIDSYLVEDVTVDGDNITFSWELTPKVTAYKGQIRFVMCVTGPDTKVAWHTTLGTGVVLEGLEPDYVAIQADTADVVAQLIALVGRQTAAVTAEGTTQVAVVKAAAKAAEADAVAQVEAKGASTLATIPEDYTAVQNAVRGMANAIRGKVSGEVIRVDDVSPVEHYPEIKVHGKNRFDVSKILTTTASSEYAYIREVGEDYLIVTTPTGYTGNGYCTVTQKVRDVCPSLEVGKTYILTATTESNSTNVYLPNLQKSWIFGRSMLITEQLLDSTMTFYGLSAREGMGTGDCRISNIQIEEGNTATDYTPYIDPTTVTVRRCGKNIFNVAAKSQTLNGVTLTVNNDGTVSVTGTATKATFFGLGSLVLKPGAKYRLSGCPAGGKFDTYILYIHNNTNGSDTYDLGEGKVFTGQEGDLGVTLAVYAGTTVNNLVFRPMVVVGEGVESFEPYLAETQIPMENGVVSGLGAVSPTMTLLTNTAGVTIDCEYSRDTNKVIAEILNKITALGG